MKGWARWSKVASRDLAALKGPSWERSHGLLTPRLPGALGRARDWLHAARCSWVGRWMGSGAQEAQSAGSVRPSAQDGGRPVHAPSRQAPSLAPLLPPKEEHGGAAPGWRCHGLLHPTEVPTPTRPQLLHKSMTYLQPAPDGPAPCQPAARRRAKGRRGRCQTGAGQRDLCAQAAGRARRAGARPAEPRPPPLLRPLPGTLGRSRG